jgi:integrase/recombinase XerD
MRLPKPKRTLPERASRLGVLMDQHLTWLAMHNYSDTTVATRRTTIGYFLDWCADRALEDPASITRPVLESYQRMLFQHRKDNGQPLTFRTQNQRLRAIKGFFKWLTRENHILHNPASELLLPRIGKALPKYVLTAAEAEQVMHTPDVHTSEGLRDRAMLETLYSTAMRRMELANLRMWDIDRERSTVMIRRGKGQKDRHIPIAERALNWIERYVNEARPHLLMRADEGVLFLNYLGEAFERTQLTKIVDRYLRKSGVNKKGGCHLFRHTAATLMLENGADVRVIQELLGHSQLSTTEIYTHVSINLLKQVYAATHPAAKLLEELELEAEEENEGE